MYDVNLNWKKKFGLVSKNMVRSQRCQVTSFKQSCYNGIKY